MSSIYHMIKKAEEEERKTLLKKIKEERKTFEAAAHQQRKTLRTQRHSLKKLLKHGVPYERACQVLGINP